MESLQSHSPAPTSRDLEHLLVLYGLLFVGLLPEIRTQMTKQNPSAFEDGNGVFMIIAIATLFAVEVVFGILFCTNIYRHPSSRGKCYTILKLICTISACLGPCSLLYVDSKDSRPTDNELMVVMRVISVVSFVAIGSCSWYICSCSENDLSKTSFAFLGLVRVPLSLVLVLFVPINLSWIVYSVICLSLAIDFIYIFNTIFKLIIQKTEAQLHDKNNKDLETQQDKNTDLEAQQVIQQDNTTMIWKLGK